MIWQCALCNHRVEADERPFVKWDDGHYCVMVEPHRIKKEICHTCMEAEATHAGRCEKCRRKYEKMRKEFAKWII